MAEQRRKLRPRSSAARRWRWSVVAIAAAGTLTALALSPVLGAGSTHRRSATAEPAAAAGTPGSVDAVEASKAVPLTDPGFEGPYRTVGSSSPNVTGVIASGWTDNSAWANVTAHYSRDTVDPHRGTSDQEVTVTAVPTGSFQMLQTFEAIAGTLYRPGLWLRGTPGTVVDLVLQSDRAPYVTISDDPVYLTATWQLATVPVHVTTSGPVDLMVSDEKPTTFYADDASLGASPGPITPAVDARPGIASFGMHTGNYLASKGPFNLTLGGPFVGVDSPESTITGRIGQWWSDNSDWADVTASYQPDTDTPHGGHTAQRVVVSRIARGDVQAAQVAYLNQGTRYSLSAWLRASPGMQIGLGIQEGASPNTVYASQRQVGDGQWHQYTATGTVTQPGTSLILIYAFTTGTLDFDDVSVLDSAGHPPTGLPWPSTPFGTWRLWDQAGTTWAAVEPDRGEWNFTQLDEAVAAARAHHVRIILTLGQTPTWASSQPTLASSYGLGAAAPPVLDSDWVAYVRAVATRYRGQIFDYEIWNEPGDPQYYTGSIARLVTLTRLASQTLTAVDRHDVVIGAAATNTGWLDQYLADGAAPWIDVVAFHLYDYDAAPESDLPTLADVRTVMSDNRISDKPLWVTEGAVGDTSTAEGAAPGLLARKYLVELLYGAQLFGWYSWGPATSYCLGTTAASPGTTSAAGAALRYLEGWLADATVRGVRTLPDGTWQVSLVTPTGSPAFVVWNPAATVDWVAPAGFTPRSVATLSGRVQTLRPGGVVSVDGQPVLISARPEST